MKQASTKKNSIVWFWMGVALFVFITIWSCLQTYIAVEGLKEPFSFIWLLLCYVIIFIGGGVFTAAWLIAGIILSVKTQNLTVRIPLIIIFAIYAIGIILTIVSLTQSNMIMSMSFIWGAEAAVVASLVFGMISWKKDAKGN